VERRRRPGDRRQPGRGREGPRRQDQGGRCSDRRRDETNARSSRRRAGTRTHSGKARLNYWPELLAWPARTAPMVRRVITRSYAVHMVQDGESHESPDIKPRSRDVTDGIERAAARGMLRAVGMGDDDWVKPQIGVASSWNEITPCNLSLDRLAKGVKDGVHAAQGYPLEFGTISVSDGISMGHEGMHYSLVSREVIADSVETVMGAERLDGSVLLAGCDKSLPGMLMAAARLDLASVFLYAGSTLPGNVDGKDVTIIDAFEAVGA